MNTEEDILAALVCADRSIKNATKDIEESLVMSAHEDLLAALRSACSLVRIAETELFFASSGGFKGQEERREYLTKAEDLLDRTVAAALEHKFSDLKAADSKYLSDITTALWYLRRAS